MTDINVSMIAFHSDKKPEPLKELLNDVFGIIYANLPPSAAWSFTPYDFSQIHSTIIGMEAKSYEEIIFGYWFKKISEEIKEIDIDVLHELVSRYFKKKLLRTVRFCGYRKAHCSCQEQENPDRKGEEFECKTSEAEFHSCDRTPYEGSFYAFSSGPVMITGWPIESHGQKNKFPHNLFEFRYEASLAGFLHKFHGAIKLHWRDDDCYLRIGSFTSEVAKEQLAATVSAVRDYLSKRKPVTIDLTTKNVEIVQYINPAMKDEHITARYTLQEFIKDPSRVKDFYKLSKTPPQRRAE